MYGLRAGNRLLRHRGGNCLEAGCALETSPAFVFFGGSTPELGPRPPNFWCFEIIHRHTTPSKIPLNDFVFCWPSISLWFLINDQLDAQFFSKYLFQFSTRFEQPSAHHQENQLYQYNLYYMSLCVGDRFVCMSERNFPTCTRNGHRHRVTYTTRCCIDTVDSPDDEHSVARNT